MKALLPCLLPLVAAAPAGAQRSVWIVDPNNRPGAHFTSVQAAANAAAVAPGDVLRLRDGAHGSLLTSKPLVVLGSRQAWLTHLVIRDIPAGSEFVLSGCEMLFHYTALAGIELYGCQGRVVLSGIRYSAPGPQPQYAMLRLIGAADCRDLEIVDVRAGGGGVLFGRSSVTIRESVFIGASGNPPVLGIDALVAHQCRLEIIDSLFRGVPGILPGVGARIIDGTAHVFATGPGTTRIIGSSFTGAPMAPSLRILRARVVIDPQVDLVGAIENVNGTAAVRSLPALSGSVGSGSASATLFAPAGTPAALAFGFAHPPMPLAGLGNLRLDPRRELFGIVVGTASAARPLATGRPVPPNTSLLGAMFAAQGIAWIHGAPALSNGAILLIQ